MRLDLTRGDTRPALIGLAVLTLLGWGLFLYAKLDDAENQRGARRDILAVTANLDAAKACRGRSKIRPPGRHGSGISNADPGMIRSAARLSHLLMFGSPGPQPTAAAVASISPPRWPDFAPPCTDGCQSHQG